jgi:hypothetical protein
MYGKNKGGHMAAFCFEKYTFTPAPDAHHPGQRSAYDPAQA